ncbi:MAG: hypothetical protein CRN43_17110, partial [Candidatus Nephrothrix sp. EaCA]
MKVEAQCNINQIFSVCLGREVHKTHWRANRNKLNCAMITQDELDQLLPTMEQDRVEKTTSVNDSVK